MIDQKVVDQILDQAQIAEVVGDFVTLHRKGQDFVGLCPFHDDSRPSFHVSVSKNICKCFACGEGGSPLTFVMKHENIQFVEAIKYLGRKYGIEVKESEMSQEEAALRTEREKLLLANSFARDIYKEVLHQQAEGRMVGLSYFKERGLSNETIKRFELGYSPSEYTFLADRAKQKGLEPETLEQVGLIMKSKRGDWIDRYRERIIFPIHSISGNIVGFGGRILKKVENVGKYINSPASSLYDKSNELYGLYFAKRALSKKDRCIVVEGYMDVLWMHQRGIENVVASSGTALTPQQVQLIKRYTTNVTLIFDSDNAGIKAALKGLDICLSKGMNVNTVLLPDGEDPDSFAKNHTLEEVEDYIESQKKDGLEFKINILEKELGTSAQAKNQILEELTESLSLIDNDLTRDIYVRAVAARMEVTIDILMERVSLLRHTRAEEARRAHIREQVRLREKEETKQVNSPNTAPLQNIATGATPLPNAASRVKAPKIKDPFLPFEEVLFKYLITDGIKFIDFYTSDEEHDKSTKMGATVVEIIQIETSDLREQGILSPKFTQLLDELVEQIDTNPNLASEKYLTRHQDATILHYATAFIINQPKLSKKHEKYEIEQKDNEVFFRKLMKDLLGFKLSAIETALSNKLSTIEEMNQNQVSEKELSQLMSEISNLAKMKADVSKVLGNRILTPKNRL